MQIQGVTILADQGLSVQEVELLATQEITEWATM